MWSLAFQILAIINLCFSLFFQYTGHTDLATLSIAWAIYCAVKVSYYKDE